MHKLLMKFILPFVLLSFFVVKSEAALDYNQAYMVTDNNSTTLADYNSITNEYHYNNGQTPWVYLKLKLADLNLAAPLKVLWSWSSFTDPYDTQNQYNEYNLAGLSTDKELWSATPEPWWSAQSNHGKWTVDVAWLNAQGSLGTSTATFNVTPEPISSALFLFGGVPMAAALLRKKKVV